MCITKNLQELIVCSICFIIITINNRVTKESFNEVNGIKIMKNEYCVIIGILTKMRQMVRSF